MGRSDHGFDPVAHGSMAAGRIEVATSPSVSAWPRVKTRERVRSIGLGEGGSPAPRNIASMRIRGSGSQPSGMTCAKPSRRKSPEGETRDRFPSPMMNSPRSARGHVHDHLRILLAHDSAAQRLVSTCRCSEREGGKKITSTLAVSSGPRVKPRVFRSSGGAARVGVEQDRGRGSAPRGGVSLFAADWALTSPAVSGTRRAFERGHERRWGSFPSTPRIPVSSAARAGRTPRRNSAPARARRRRARQPAGRRTSGHRVP